MAVDYSKQKILVVEDLPEFRMSIRQMLMSFSADDVTICGSADDAINHCRQAGGFDIVLCDYNLGESKDGQQLLEELRILGLLRYTSIFMMLTAENSVDMVLGALEFRPDAYITKPFNKADLRSRLDRLFRLKDELYELNCALDESDLEDALMQCDVLLHENTAYKTQVLRTKSDILFKLNRLDECQRLLEPIVEEKDYDWAKLGLAKVLYQKEQYSDSEAMLTNLLKKNQRHVEVYDWLSQIKQVSGDPVGAQSVLKKAVAVSPKSRARQNQLASIAEQNEDFDTAARAYRRTLELSKNTIHMNPRNVISLVDCLYKKAEKDTSLSGRKAANDALKVIDENHRALKKDNEAFLQSKIAEARIYHVQNHDDKAKACLAEAAQLREDVSMDLGPETTLKLAEGFLTMGELDEAFSLMNAVDESEMSDAQELELVKKIKSKMLENDAFKDYQNQMIPENQDGIRHYEAGEIDQAIRCFAQAKKASADSVSINLNLLQAIIKKIEAEKPSKKLISIGDACLDVCKDLSEQHEKYPRYAQLKQLFESRQAISQP